MAKESADNKSQGSGRPSFDDSSRGMDENWDADVSRDWDDERLGSVVARLLRTGVVFAATLVFLGGMIYLLRHGSEDANYGLFQGQRSSFRSVSGIFSEAFSFSGRGIVLLGILVLVATPVLRVVTCLWAFLHQRDWTYVAVSLTVLGFLLASLFIGPL